MDDWVGYHLVRFKSGQGKILMLKLAQMGPKPIQDIAPPQAASLPATPPPAEPSASGPEIVGDIPVRASVGQVSDEPKTQGAKDDDSNFIVPATPLPAATSKNKEKPKNKDSKPKPTLAIVVAVLAIICLVAGTYLKFFSNR